MATDTLEFKLVMRPAKMNFAVAHRTATTESVLVVRADEILTALLEGERAMHQFAVSLLS